MRSRDGTGSKGTKMPEWISTSVFLKRRAVVFFTLIAIAVVAAVVWYPRLTGISIRGSVGLVTAMKSLDAQIADAARAGITRDSLPKHVSVPPAVDTSTREGQILFDSARISADDETIHLLKQCVSLTYWIIEDTGDKSSLAGIAWDQLGHPHYFRAKRR